MNEHDSNLATTRRNGVQILPVNRYFRRIRNVVTRQNDGSSLITYFGSLDIVAPRSHRMNLGILGTLDFTPQFFLNALSIVLIDIVLAGDNSVVIAMAVRSLPKDKRTKGIILGAMAAVLLRIIFTFFAAKLLLTPLVGLIGGALILWIAVKLMVDDQDHKGGSVNAPTIWKAVWIILVADVTMSLDNILAVAGASHGNFFLLLFGFGLSIPLVVFTSSLISKLMDRFPVIVWVGAAILGKVGAGMMVGDSWVIRTLLVPLHLTRSLHDRLEPVHWLVWVAEVAGVIGVLGLAVLLRRKKPSPAQ